MKRIWLYLLILISPFLFIVLINETVGYDKSYVIKSKIVGSGSKFYALNSDEKFEDKCSWYCHNEGCDKLKHPKDISKGFVRELYFSIIQFNKDKPVNYAEMNVFLFVIVVPLLVYILIVLNIEVYFRNKKKRLS
jgi:hypothetical protein